MTASVDGAALLEVRKLSVSFGAGTSAVTAVRGLSFSIDKGEIVALVGESGSGKSTTAMAIARLLPESARASGTVSFMGQELLGLDRERMRKLRGDRIGVVFQDPFSYLNPVKTVGWQVAEVLQTHKSLPRAKIKEEVIDLLRLVGIKQPHERYGAYPHQFSGGMRQRVMIAMAIACRPALLIADEPTTALDVTVQDRIIGLLLDLRDRYRMGVLLITHNLGLVARVADRALVLRDGNLVEHAEVGQLFSAPRHAYTKQLLDAVPRIPTSETWSREQ